MARAPLLVKPGFPIFAPLPEACSSPYLIVPEPLGLFCNRLNVMIEFLRIPKKWVRQMVTEKLATGMQDSARYPVLIK